MLNPSKTVSVPSLSHPKDKQALQRLAEASEKAKIELSSLNEVRDVRDVSDVSEIPGSCQELLKLPGADLCALHYSRRLGSKAYRGGHHKREV